MEGLIQASETEEVRCTGSERIAEWRGQRTERMLREQTVRFDGPCLIQPHQSGEKE